MRLFVVHSAAIVLVVEHFYFVLVQRVPCPRVARYRRGGRGARVTDAGASAVVTDVAYRCGMSAADRVYGGHTPRGCATNITAVGAFALALAFPPLACATAGSPAALPRVKLAPALLAQVLRDGHARQAAGAPAGTAAIAAIITASFDISVCARALLTHA